MTVHYGGEVSRVEGHVAQPHTVRLDPEYFPGSPESIVVNSYHQFGIYENGQSQELKAIAWGEDGTVEAAIHTKFSQYGIMWHPEREESLSTHDLLAIRSLFGESDQ